MEVRTACLAENLLKSVETEVPEAVPEAKMKTHGEKAPRCSVIMRSMARITQCFDDLFSMEPERQFKIRGPNSEFSVAMASGNSVVDLLRRALWQYKLIEGCALKPVASARLQTQTGKVVKTSQRLSNVDADQVYTLIVRSARGGVYERKCGCTVVALCGKCSVDCCSESQKHSDSDFSHKPLSGASVHGKKAVQFSTDIEVQNYELDLRSLLEDV